MEAPDIGGHVHSCEGRQVLDPEEIGRQQCQNRNGSRTQGTLSLSAGSQFAEQGRYEIHVEEVRAHTGTRLGNGRRNRAGGLV